MKNFLSKITDLISMDVRASRFADFENSIVDRFTLHLHNFSFFFFLVVLVLFYADLWLLNGTAFSGFLNFFDLGDVDVIATVRLHKVPLTSFYLAGGVLAIILGIASAIYFYIRHGADIGRYELHARLIWKSLLLTTLFSIMLAPFLIFAFYGGGYLLGIRFPYQLYLNYIPGFFLVQILVLIKMLTYVTGGTCGYCMMLFPYSLHPGRLNKRA